LKKKERQNEERKRKTKKISGSCRKIFLKERKNKKE
jgi:hypothetical protein